VSRREFPDLLGGRVDVELVVDKAVGVAGRVECGGQPIGIRRSYPGAHARLGADGGEGRGPEKPPMGQDEHVVGGLLDLAQRVAGQQHRATLVREPTYVPAQPPNPRRVEPVRGLVQDEHTRVTEHRRGQPEPLPHAEGELPDSPPRIGRQPGLIQDATRRALGQPGRGREDAQVVERGTSRVAARRLEDGADLTRRVGQLVVSLATERSGPAGRCHEPEQHP